MNELFPFQKEDVEHLGIKQSVLIANEMGTGKTYEAIDRDRRIRENFSGRRPPTLVIAPLTTLWGTWYESFHEQTDLKVAVLDNKERKRSWEMFRKVDADVFIMHWEALRLMPEVSQEEWLHVIADECHRAKNRKAQQTRCLKAVRAVGYKTAMSGTPVVNRPDELWSILNWLWPKTYGSYWRFFKQHVETSSSFARGHQYQVIVGPKNLELLHRALAPYFVRRLKKDVLPQLPEKYYTTIKVDLTPTQRTAYNQMRDEMIAWIGEQQDEVLPAPVVIAQLTRLQQFAVAFAEYDGNHIRLSEPSSKLDAAMEVLDESGDAPIVFFSRFKQLITLLEYRLRDKSIPYVAITGDVPPEVRTAAVKRFQEGRARVMVGTIGAGGVGIDLYAASTVVFLDRDWSPALNAQAEDRLHRIGQRNAVQVIDIMARGTVDLGKAQRLELKKTWIRRILGDET